MWKMWKHKNSKRLTIFFELSFVIMKWRWKAMKSWIFFFILKDEFFEKIFFVVMRYPETHNASLFFYNSIFNKKIFAWNSSKNVVFTLYNGFVLSCSWHYRPVYVNMWYYRLLGWLECVQIILVDLFSDFAYNIFLSWVKTKISYHSQFINIFFLVFLKNI